MTEEIREGTVEEEIATLDGEMKCMEAELGEERATPLSRDEKTSTTAEVLVRQEQRKAILLRFTSAAKITRRELRTRQYKLHSMVMHWEIYERLWWKDHEQAVYRNEGFRFT
jgi:hypothetical protein